MRMQLRVRRLSARDTPSGRVAVGGRDQILGGLLDDLGAIAAANDRHPLTQIADRALDRPGVRCLDLLTLPRVPSAQTTDTDFGALNVTSIPPPREPSAPALRSHRPVPGCRPSINAMKSPPSTGAAGSTPRRASVSGAESQLPGASASSPPGVR